MGQLDIASLIEETPAVLAAWPAETERSEKKVWKPAAVMADIATLGVGTLAAAFVNVGLVFLIPKLVSVEDFGYWRMFALYAGYVGFLDFGFGDGALLRWAGKRMDEFHGEIFIALKYLFYQHSILIIAVSAIAALVISGPLRFVAIALAVYALIYNELTVMQFALQSAKLFRPVALSTVGTPALFLLLVLLSHRRSDHYPQIIAFFAAGSALVLLLLIVRVKPWGKSRPRGQLLGFAKSCIRSGWPIVLANTSVMIIIYADRLAVSWSANIQQFAQYSMAGSAMAVPITAIQSCSKVFFSHLAGETADSRRQIYGISSRLLLIAWAILLPYYFALNIFIRHFLPKYIPSLVYARILLLAIPFLATIQILQMSFAYLNGMQKRFLGQSIIVLAITISTSSLIAFGTRSFQVVAGVQVLVLGGWWLYNEWSMRVLTGEHLREWLKFLAFYVLASASYWLSTAPAAPRFLVSLSIYYLTVVLLQAVLCRKDVTAIFTMLRSTVPQLRNLSF